MPTGRWGCGDTCSHRGMVSGQASGFSCLLSLDSSLKRHELEVVNQKLCRRYSHVMDLPGRVICLPQGGRYRDGKAPPSPMDAVCGYHLWKAPPFPP